MLSEIRSEGAGTTAIGRRFEKLIRSALQRHPGEYGPNRFKRVWLWHEWPERTSLGYGQDLGIDLVAEQTKEFGGGLCAIQCKCYSAESKIPIDDINSFLAASGTRVFKSRILVATSEPTASGWKKVQQAEPRCEVLLDLELSSWPVRWTDYLDHPDSLEFRTVRHTPRRFQEEAIAKVINGFEEGADRGQLILPCGTGKSVVAMWIAERFVGKGGTVLYLVPSIALMGQTMREWARHQDPGIAHRYLGVCSDYKAGRASEDSDLTELAMPVSTDAESIVHFLREKSEKHLNVVFCTYQSLPVLATAQDQCSVNSREFDLGVCDEAHRTTGIADKRDLLSGFRLVHNRDRVRAAHRLFMTATPRMYTESARKSGRDRGEDFGVFSMDDHALYGRELYRMDFADAVESGYLADYRVLVIAVDESLANEVHGAIAIDDRRNLSTVDVVKLAGCWDALADPTTRTIANRDTGFLHPERAAQRAIVFTNTIAKSRFAERYWEPVIKAHGDNKSSLECDVLHVDGGMNAFRRAQSLQWLKDGGRYGVCRILTNAKCLTEGVDVPALDAVVFFQPKSSQVDIVQAVGRVMRKPDQSKEIGYIVIPVIVPEGKNVADDDVLNGSDFKNVWRVLKALRSHDGRADVWVNSTDVRAPVEVIVTGKLCPTCGERDCVSLDGKQCPHGLPLQLTLPWHNKIASKIVEKCGDRQYWDRWAGAVAEICERIENRMRSAQAQNQTIRRAMTSFNRDLKSAVGPHISNEQMITMVAQHAVTSPVFDALFGASGFA